MRLSDEMKVFGRALEVVRSSGDVIADVRMLLFVVYAAVRAYVTEALQTRSSPRAELSVQAAGFQSIKQSTTKVNCLRHTACRSHS